MEKLKNYLSKHLWLLILPLCYFSVRALLVPGFYGASDDLHIAWLYEMDRLIKISQIPPRFVPDLSFGFGYPLFNFVFPLPFYIGEIFHLIGLNFVDSVKSVFFISLPLSGIFMYQFLKKFASNILSLAGAVTYMYIPYRSTDMYVRGAIGENVAFIFLPLIALSAINLSPAGNVNKTLNIRWIGIGALSLAGLVLTHNITAYMFLPFIFILVLLRLIIFKKHWLSLVNLIVSLLLALIVSLYFWLPALLDSSLMKYDTVFNFVDHFPTLQQLVIPYWGYGASVAGPNDGMSFYLGSVSLTLLVLGLLLMIILWKKFSVDQKIILSWAGISFLIALLMMNFRSIFIWQNVPLIPFFQFPWRFLIITTFAMPVFVIAFEKLRFQKLIASLIIVIALLATANVFHPHDYLGRADDYYFNRYIPLPASSEYSQLHEEYLRLPKDTDQRPDKNYPRVYPQTGQIKSVSEIDSLTAVINTDSSDKFTLNYNKYYFPGWFATIDGQKAEIIAGKPFGQIVLTVPSGNHLIKIGYKEPVLKVFLDIISIVGFVIAFSLAVSPGVFRSWRRTSE